MNTLFDKPETKTDFEKYDTEHPEIWRQFKAITFRLINKGIKHYGAKAVFEVIRWERIIAYSESEFKVNNNYTKDYSRKFMRLYPEHKEFFETRKAKI